MQVFIALLGSLFLTAASPGPQEYYVDVPYNSTADLKNLVEQGFDIGGVNVEKGIATLIVRAKDRARVVPLQVLAERPIEAPDSQYAKYTDVEKALKDAEDLFPGLVRMKSIGKSVEGRDIYAVEITDQFMIMDKPKETVLFDAMHHAREVMTTEVAIDLIRYLTEKYSTEPRVQQWLAKYAIWVIPMLNPDGNNKVWNEDSMWRKNARGGYGVDVNRNYPYAWNSCGGSSGDKYSDTYRGSGPGSEPETQAIMNLVSQIKPKFNISYHSFSEIVIYPYGCSPLHVSNPDAATYYRIGKELGQKLVRDNDGGTYDVGTSYELLYNVDGGSIDWMYEQEKVMSFVVEVNSSSAGFQPSYKTWRDKTVAKQRAGWMYILDQMDKPGIK